MTLQQMLYYKQLKGYSYAQLSELSGVPLGTIQKIFCGETKSPRYATLQALEKALLGNDSVTDDSATNDSVTYNLSNHQGKGMSKVEESAVYRSSRSSYTLEDYYALPDERRVELIDGEFYDMAAPATYHQLCILRLSYEVADYIFRKGGKCTPFPSPVDVQLDCDNRTMVQPDFLIVCDPKKITGRCVIGAPDFIVEVLSKSTERKDLTLKLTKYRNAGVREYWIIDLEKERVLTYFFEEEEFPHLYGADGQIPVGIYQGELVMPMNEIFEQVRNCGV